MPLRLDHLRAAGLADMAPGTTRTKVRIRARGTIAFSAQMSASVVVLAIRRCVNCVEGWPLWCSVDVADVILRAQDGWSKRHLVEVAEHILRAQRSGTIVSVWGYPEKMRTKTSKAATICIHAEEIHFGQDIVLQSFTEEQASVDAAPCDVQRTERVKKFRVRK